MFHDVDILQRMRRTPAGARKPVLKRRQQGYTLQSSRSTG